MDSRYLAHGQKLRELRIDFSGKVKAKNPPTTRLCDSLKSTPQSGMPSQHLAGIFKYPNSGIITASLCSIVPTGINRPGSTHQIQVSTGRVFRTTGSLSFLRRREERLFLSWICLEKVPNIFSHMVV